MSYVIGVSSGAFTVTGQEEKIQLIGLFKKAQSSITKGIQFIQLDLESVAEFREPDLHPHLKRIEEMGITFGVHSETAAFGIEMSEPDSAIQVDYEYGHNRLAEVLQESGSIGAKYVLIHSSESVPFALLGRHLQPAILVDVWGRSLKKFIEENGWVIDWIIPKDLKSDGAFIWDDILPRSLSEWVESRVNDRREEYMMARHPREAEPPEDLKQKWRDYYINDLKDYFIGFIESRAHHYGPERYAYFIIAKWMEKNNDPLWSSIVEMNIKFFAEYEKKTSEKWLADKKIERVNGKWSIDNKNFRNEYKLWVPAVSAKYLWGHFNQDKCPDGKQYVDLKEKLKVKKDDKEYIMPLVLESPMAHRGTEEWLRLPNPLQFYYLAKEINKGAGFEAVAIAFDLEHMISIRVDPETVLKLLPEDGGKLVRVIHAGWPAPLAPAHLPIHLGSEQQFYLYKIYYKLKEKGFGGESNKDCYMIFERGGPETFQESVLSLRNIISFLEKGIRPEDLIKHPEFSGIVTGEIASEERQRAIIVDHAEEPLKGLLMVPEEKYGFFSRAAVEKGKTKEWEKEEFR